MRKVIILSPQSLNQPEAEVLLCSVTQASSPSPVFGSASTFGAGTGFGGFKNVGAAPSRTPAKDAEKEDGTPPEEGTGETEEECSAEFRPLVQLEEVERVSGEEGEETLIDLCAPLHLSRILRWRRSSACCCDMQQGPSEPASELRQRHGR